MIRALATATVALGLILCGLVGTAQQGLPLSNIPVPIPAMPVIANVPAIGGVLVNPGPLSIGANTSLGTAPGTSINLANNGFVRSRNSTNTGDGNLLGLNSADIAVLAPSISSIDIGGTGDPSIRLGAGSSNAALRLGNTIMLVQTAPTISSGFGTSPSIVSSLGTTTFRLNVGTGGVATSGVVGLATATTGWNCQVTDQGPGAIDATRQTASTTTTVTVTAATAWAASDILIFNCSGF